MSVPSKRLADLIVIYANFWARGLLQVHGCWESWQIDKWWSDVTGIHIVICKELQRRSRMCKRNIVPLPSFDYMKLQNQLGHCWTRISKCRCDERNGSLYLERKHFHYNLLQQNNSEFCGVYMCCWSSITVKFLLLLTAISWCTLHSWKCANGFALNI